jgi:putative membrane protein
MLSNINLNQKAFILYKWFNSLFLGLSIGSVFTIYEPLEPSVYSLGGIVLAAAMIIVAKYYYKILNAYYFFRISLAVEVIVLAMLVTFLIFSYSYQIALLIYIGYQITFVFGSYLVRAETLVFKEDSMLTKIDMAKQIGYLVGMAASYAFYKSVEHFELLSEKQEQVYYIHFLLVAIELMVIILLWKAFNDKR